MLLQQITAPFTANPNVDVTWRACNIKVLGTLDAVTVAHDYISDQLDKYLYVEDRYILFPSACMIISFTAWNSSIIQCHNHIL